MDYFPIVFVVVAIAGIYGFWRLGKFMFKKLVAIAPKVDEGEDFTDGGSKEDISGKFEATVRTLEFERLKYYNKSKGLFKRSYFRAWFVMATIFIGILLSVTDVGDINFVLFIGPLIITAFLALIGAGIYTLVKKGSSADAFTRRLKQELVTEIVRVVDPGMKYFEGGIEEAEFNKAGIFPTGKNTSLTSEDRIEGIIDGNKVTISECRKTGIGSAPREAAEIKVKGMAISSQRGNYEGGIDTVEYFRGLFVQMELKSIVLGTPLKIIPNNRLGKEMQSGIQVMGGRHLIKTPNMEEKLDGILALANKPYTIFCSAKDEANTIVTGNFIKVLDFIYEKYHQKRKSNDVDSVIGQLLFKDRAVYITIHENMLYLALDWNKDMFETDTFMKKSLIESGIAQEIYDDLQFVTQVIKEVNLFNKVVA
jgi:archaellum component FlaG (FlaF/FlaG flagellin family)